jgi:4-phytase/acid phosphatase
MPMIPPSPSPSPAIRWGAVRPALLCVLSALSAACASGHSAIASGPAEPPQALRLQRVVMLMRHGVRPPTRADFAPRELHDQPWPAWPVDYGLLTPHGYAAVRLLGQWDRRHWTARGLLPPGGCLASSDIAVAASSKSRTQETARALIEGLAPGCQVDVAFPASPAQDVEFHPLESGAMPIDADQALRAVQALLPAGGLEAEVASHASQFALLHHALGCTPERQPACDLSKRQPGLVRNEADRPDVGDPFGIASTLSQTFLLQYLEGMPMEDVAWGRLSPGQIGTLLEFNTLKFRYEGRAPYVAARAASPLAARMLRALQHGPKLTVLAGHDTNIADLGGLLDLHWQVPGYPRDNPPPGGALGFELLADADGNQFVRAFYRSQTMDQVRGLQPLSAANPPSYAYLPVPGCADRCTLDAFTALLGPRLVQPAGRP